MHQVGMHLSQVIIRVWQTAPGCFSPFLSLSQDIPAKAPAPDHLLDRNRKMNIPPLLTHLRPIQAWPDRHVGAETQIGLFVEQEADPWRLRNLG